MKEIIEAFQIFAKYSDEPYPTHCEHDVMYVVIDPQLVSKEDIERLEQLGFSPEETDGDCSFYSYRYGSC